mmetsp:Transcript_32570/g.47171  ORF Transcript_32570/g.47171 Transcript_32570/m.47171 type:complete len:109 (+) Transcript_32570:789-1115(+)
MVQFRDGSPSGRLLKLTLKAKACTTGMLVTIKLLASYCFFPKVSKGNGSDEDGGFVVSIIHDSTLRSCGLMVWKASSFEQGPIAQIDLGELVPWCVHGSWVPGFVSSQ